MPLPIDSAAPMPTSEALPADRTSAPAATPAAPRPSSNARWAMSGALACLSPFKRQTPATPPTAGALQRPAPKVPPRAMARQKPWDVRTGVADMATLSDKRVKLWFKKSASEQYLYAKSLLPEQRDELEQELAQTMRGNTPAAGEALTMWLSVQQARLRTHSPLQQQLHRSQQVANAIPSATVVGAAVSLPALMNTRIRYYQSDERPEYAKAFDNFMSVIGDPSLPPEVRNAAAERLEYHAWSEGTIAPQEQHLLYTHGARRMADEGYRVPRRTFSDLFAARPVGPGLTKEAPYFSSKRPLTNLNGQIAFEKGMEPTDVNVDKLWCRHLALAYCLSSDDNDGKFDFDKLSISGPLHYDNFVDHAWRDKYLQPRNYLHGAGMGPDARRAVVDSDRFGASLANAFKKLESTGQSHASAVINVAEFGETGAKGYSGHAMAMTIKVKTDPGKGTPVYVVTVYDPNHTVTHKRVRVTDLQSLERLAFRDFIDPDFSYGNAAAIAVLSKTMPAGFEDESAAADVGVVKARIGLALRENVPEALDIVAAQLSEPGLAQIDHGKLADTLDAKEASGVSMLSEALKFGNSEAVRAYGRLLNKAGLPPHMHARLLGTTVEPGIPAFNSMMKTSYYNSWDTIETFAEVVADAHLPAQAKVDLLEGKDAEGTPALSSATKSENAAAAGLLMKTILHSTLPVVMKSQLLAAKDAQGTPALAHAMERGDPYTVMRFMKQIGHSDLPDAVKVELIAARSTDGTSGLARAEQAGHSELLNLYKDLIGQMSLPEAMKTELMTTGKPAH
ncbi:ShET2/EspL2 family type III secretion system effector toxin [Trinickia soli]|uniref:ShET2/EspL2 family type III secretion system effector toxin n=1 Tax=Trinickia soli TaxID=380675 RepID=UPI003FA37B9B